jgi:hypothetical protein
VILGVSLFVESTAEVAPPLALSSTTDIIKDRIGRAAVRTSLGYSRSVSSQNVALTDWTEEGADLQVRPHAYVNTCFSKNVLRILY